MESQGLVADSRPTLLGSVTLYLTCIFHQDLASHSHRVLFCIWFALLSERDGTSECGFHAYQILESVLRRVLCHLN
jgi:hypothetical protein